MTVDQNRREWSAYDWQSQGSEWSSSWGGDNPLWLAVIYPRIQAFMPCTSILEIGCGYGRFTSYLHSKCRNFVGIDLTPKCVDACCRRFPYSTFHVGDGKLFPQVRDASINFAFSWDALVHCDLDVLDSYITELRRILIPNSSAFLHHSNAAVSRAINNGARAKTSHIDVANICERLGMRVKFQEIVHWEGARDMDCFSLIENSPWTGRSPVYTNDDWLTIQRNSLNVSKAYV